MNITKTRVLHASGKPSLKRDDPSRATRPSVTIVIPTYHAPGLELLLATLTVQAQIEQVQEILVVGQQDGAAEFERLSKVRLIEVVDRPTPARNRNIGAAEAEGDALRAVEYGAAPVYNVTAGDCARVVTGFAKFCRRYAAELAPLAEEFIDLREAIAGGALDLNRWDSYLAELERWQSSAFLSLTLFAGFEMAALPNENDEIESLALQRHLGNIGEDSGRILEMGVGQTGAQRRAVIQQAVAVA